MSSSRRIAFVTGVLFLLTYLTSIPALYLFQPVLDDPVGYVAGGGSATRILWGAFLELLLIIANIGTAVVLFPLLRRQSEILALGFVMARVVESIFIAIGLFAVLGVVTLQQEVAAADPALAHSLAGIKDWTFLLGPGFVVGVGNGLILGYLMYRSGLVPRPLAVLGLIGGALLCASGIAILFDVLEFAGTGQGIASIPEFLWELALGIWLTVKGFTPSPIAAAYDRDVGHEVG